MTRDFRVWWALFVFFGVLSVLALQQGYRRWHRLRGLLPRSEGWRLACMAASLAVMTALVFAGVMGAPQELLLALRLLAVALVLAVVVLSIPR